MLSGRACKLAIHKTDDTFIGANLKSRNTKRWYDVWHANPIDPALGECVALSGKPSNAPLLKLLYIYRSYIAL